jgi:hypothetical protein
MLVLWLTIYCLKELSVGLVPGWIDPLAGGLAGLQKINAAGKKMPMYQNDKALEGYFLIINGLRAMGSNPESIKHTARLLEALAKETRPKAGKKVLLRFSESLREYAR